MLSAVSLWIDKGIFAGIVVSTLSVMLVISF